MSETQVVLAGFPVVETEIEVVARLSDAERGIIETWVRRQQSPLTRRSYRGALLDYLAFMQGKPLYEVELDDLLDYRESLSEFADATQARILASLKSFFSFAQKTMPTVFVVNVGAALPVPQPREQRAQRILSVEECLQMLAMEPNPRNKLLLKVLYNAAPRLGEICGAPALPGEKADPERGLRWRDLQARTLSNGVTTGQVTFYGKGQKTRSVLLKPAVWQDLCTWRNGARDADPVFVSRKQHGPLQHSQVHDIVKAAAVRIGIDVKERPVSPHWWRHAAASHALDAGAPLSLLKEILGHEDISTTGIYTHARPNQGLGDFLAL